LLRSFGQQLRPTLQLAKALVLEGASVLTANGEACAIHCQLKPPNRPRPPLWDVPSAITRRDFFSFTAMMNKCKILKKKTHKYLFLYGMNRCKIFFKKIHKYLFSRTPTKTKTQEIIYNPVISPSSPPPSQK
jgi:hypothetical protein